MTEIAIVGAGLAGLTAALRLTAAGYRVRIFERYPHPGGLARAFEVGGEPLEAFYHHLFTSDTDYVRLAAELGLADTIEWLPSRMGIWTDGRLWDFGTPASLLRFQPLSLLDKLRFSMAVMRLRSSSDPTPFERVTAADWMRRRCGERVWRCVWGPLLEQKFADHAEQVAMVWLWGKIHLRGRSRTSSGMGERLGYMRGSFGRLVGVLRERISAQGGELHLGQAVQRIERREGGFELVTRRGSFAADRVLVTAPIPDYSEIAGHLLPPAEQTRLATLRATGVACTVLVLERSLTPYYWLNVADPEMPFGGLIEHTNYVPRERYGGHTVLYVSKYLPPTDPRLRAPKTEILATLVPALARINPEFEPSWILASHHFRANYAQPVVSVGYREQIPAMRTPVPGLYLCCMAQIFPEDRGQNYAVQYAERVSQMVVEDLRGGLRQL